MAEDKRSFIPKVFKQLRYEQIIAIAFFIGVLIYLRNSTSLVPNLVTCENATNTTCEPRVINGVTFPPNTILYPPNSYVPKAPISNTELVIAIILFLAVCYILLAREIGLMRRATMTEAMNDLDAQLHGLKTLKLKDGRTIPITSNIKITLTPQFVTRYRFISGKEDKPEFRYTFLVTVHDQIEEDTLYFRAWYHPWTRYWDGFFETATALSDRDRCQYCGKYGEYDLKYLGTEDILKLKALRKELGRGDRI